jgi:hypothetical protein
MKKEKHVMKKVWKWIIGIVVGLVVLAVLVGVGFMVRGHFYASRVQVVNPRGFYQRGPELMPFGGNGYMRGPGMMGYGFNPIGGIMGGLLFLGFLALVVLGIIWLVRSLRTPKTVAVAAAMPVETPAVTPAVMPAVIGNTCKKCGKPLQDDWKVCPHCGKKV